MKKEKFVVENEDLKSRKIKEMKHLESEYSKLQPIKRLAKKTLARSKIVELNNKQIVNKKDFNKHLNNFVLGINKKAWAFLLEERYIYKKGRKYILTEKGKKMRREMQEAMIYGFI